MFRIPHQHRLLRALEWGQTLILVRVLLRPVEASRQLGRGPVERVERRLREGVVEPVVYRHVTAAHDGLAEVVETVVCLGEWWSADGDFILKMVSTYFCVCESPPRSFLGSNALYMRQVSRMKPLKGTS